jgi:hypothetical protein
MTPQIPNSKSQIPSTLRAAAVAAAIVVACGAGRAQDTRPLPDRETFSRTVRENLARAERVAYLYAFKERRTDVHTNPFGRIGTGGTRVFEVYPSATRQLTYRRLIERNGVAVAAQDLAEQDSQYRARVADVQRRLVPGNVDERRRREADSARARQRGQRRVDAAVDALQFRVEGRTVYEGVPAIVVSFAPRPGARPDTREGRIAQTFAGTAWIHEAAAEVMRVEAKSIEDIAFGFGLIARLGKGTEATLTRRPVERDLWMPTRLTLTGRGRAALFRTLVIDFAVDWFDYRRLEGDSATPFPDARVQRQPGSGPQ